MMVRDLFIFILIQLAFAAYAHAEAYMEGKDGWKWNSKWWHIPLGGGFTYTAYHVYFYAITLPILIFGVPIVLLGFDWHLIRVLVFSFCIGSNLGDFLWFVVNPDYSLKKWNPKETRWYAWTKVGRWSIPRAYLIRFLIAAILLPFIFQGWQFRI